RRVSSLCPYTTLFRSVRESSLSVSVVGQNGEVVFHESDKRIPGVMDDARLIAAAPELLEALCKTRRTIQALIDDGHMGYVDLRSDRKSTRLNSSHVKI